ncbi:hypothetical protein Tsp_05529 [Trichinella spiralis]|uniref:hypothetical protein n=1 Tax=Trichinella spiralis TaxID=6334 RepID=UPI0001EFDDB8|nr:hypothetical protein Tsp_05529 [Trichinella spiralis]
MQYLFDFVKPLTHEKHCIQISKHKAKIGERLWIGWIESFVGPLRSLVNSVCWSIAFVGQVRYVGEDTIWRCRVWKASSLQKEYKDTIHRRNKRPILRYFLTMMLM